MQKIWGFSSVSATRLVLVAFIAVFVYLASRHGSDPLQFMTITVDVFITRMTVLFLAALFIERAMEVFLTAWRGPASKAFGVEVERAQECVERNDPGCTAKLETAKGKESTHKAETQQVALLGGLALGMLTSLVGVRGLGMFLETGSEATKATTGFTVIDVLLTGALIGGGAEALHKLITVFTNFLDETAEGRKERGRQQRRQAQATGGRGDGQ